jgi:SUF system NifU family Fe-S assembly protein
MNILSLYKDTVVEHNRNPRNYGVLAHFTHAANGSNAMCGDHLHCQAILQDKKIIEVRYTAQACAIAVASTSILSDLVKGATREHLGLMRQQYKQLLSGMVTAENFLYQTSLNAFTALSDHSARHVCALLALDAFEGLFSYSSPVGDKTLTFRAAEVADSAEVLALVESAYRGDSSKKGWTTEAELLDGQRTDLQTLQGLITSPNSCIMLAEQNGKIVASSHLERHSDWAYFGMFAVNPTKQAQGIGAQLLHACERIAVQEWNCHEMRMTVIWTRLELISFYQRRGYQATGEKQPFPYGQPQFGIPKRDDLYFEVLSKTLA